MKLCLLKEEEIGSCNVHIELLIFKVRKGLRASVCNNRLVMLPIAVKRDKSPDMDIGASKRRVQFPKYF